MTAPALARSWSKAVGRNRKSAAAHGEAINFSLEERVASLIEEHSIMLRQTIDHEHQRLNLDIQKALRSAHSNGDAHCATQKTDRTVKTYSTATHKTAEEPDGTKSVAAILSQTLDGQGFADPDVSRDKKLRNQLSQDTISWAVTPSQNEDQQQRITFLRRIHRHLDQVMGVVIFVNSIVMAIQNQYEGHAAGVKLGIVTEEYNFESAKVWFQISEHIFAAIFIIEFFVRFHFARFRYFRSYLNWFDFALVVSCIIDLYIMQPLASGTTQAARILRTLKIVRVLRILRIFKVFSPLRFLAHTMTESAKALFWPMSLLGVVIIIGGFILCQLVLVFLQESEDGGNGSDRKTQLWAYHWYGTSARATRTMFEATLSGCWPNYSKTLIDEVSAAYAIFWLVYVALVIFMMIRVITALFIKETMQNAANNKEFQVEEELRKKAAYANKLREVFALLDESGDGLISWDEMSALIDNPQMRAFLSRLDLDWHEVENIFKLLDDGDGLITYEEFVAGIPKLKGQARSVDVVGLQHQGNLIVKTLDELQLSIRVMRGQLASASVQNGSSSALARDVAKSPTKSGSKSVCIADQELDEVLKRASAASLLRGGATSEDEFHHNPLPLVRELQIKTHRFTPGSDEQAKATPGNGCR